MFKSCHQPTDMAIKMSITENIGDNFDYSKALTLPVIKNIKISAYTDRKY